MKRKNRFLIVMTFCICMILSLSLICGIELNKQRELKYKTKYLTNAEVSKLQYVLDTLLLKTQTLEMLVEQNKGLVADFNKVAEKLYDNAAIRSLQLAPDGVVSFVYPLKGNENAFVDLFGTPERATEANAAKDSGELTLSGPYDLYQGGLGMIGRRPIFLTDEKGKKDFWGFSIIVLDIPEAFQPARLDIFEKEGFEYKLHRIQPDTNKTQIIAQSSKTALKKPIDISFEVPNGTWTFSVMPKGGWMDSRAIFFELLIGTIISVLITFIVVFIIQLRNQKDCFYQFSITDNLTGLYNYSYLMTMLDKFSSKNKQYTLFFMDLNGFKKVNDTYGHNVGNEVLIESAKRLLLCFQEKGDVFRNGGDEFCAVILGKSEEEFLDEMVKKISESIKQPFKIENNNIQCGISVGYARYPDDKDSMEELIQEADNRMYKMKKHKESLPA